MKIRMNLFPGGLNKALTVSYDDGQLHDLRLLDIFNENGIRGTFHLNSGKFGREEYVTDELVQTAYKGHEISVHTKTHPFLTELPDSLVVTETMEDKQKLESLVHYPVRGMSYPYGVYSDHVIDVLRSCGMEYSRTVEATNQFGVPTDFMKWHPTTHHNGDLKGLWDRFKRTEPIRMQLFYLWGHSFEFARNNNWEVIENFCKMAGGKDDIWYATNIEICQYVTAARSLIFSADQSTVYNPTATDVWFSVDDVPYLVESGNMIVIQ